MAIALHSFLPAVDEPLSPRRGHEPTSVGPLPAVPHLAEPDLQILRLMAEGYPLETVAARVHLSDRTLRRRLRSLCDRFHARAPIQVAIRAARHGLI